MHPPTTTYSSTPFAGSLAVADDIATLPETRSYAPAPPSIKGTETHSALDVLLHASTISPSIHQKQDKSEQRSTCELRTSSRGIIVGGGEEDIVRVRKRSVEKDEEECHGVSGTVVRQEGLTHKRVRV